MVYFAVKKLERTNLVFRGAWCIIMLRFLNWLRCLYGKATRSLACPPDQFLVHSQNENLAKLVQKAQNLKVCHGRKAFLQYSEFLHYKCKYEKFREKEARHSQWMYFTEFSGRVRKNFVEWSKIRDRHLLSYHASIKAQHEMCDFHISLEYSQYRSEWDTHLWLMWTSRLGKRNIVQRGQVRSLKNVLS